ncbi:MAG: Asp-tRNA(Asn)/Glu-tRNA(Gln) amidotransferase subunit GatC [Clostridia bacterium]|nr:Asp-tRNA(Asn)/Glu-tRNA(Gln) amidotransferase subunit GatC [Clostridia bacterium]
MPLTKAEVEHVALLARLALSEEEKERYAHQLGAILDYMERLNQLDTSKVEPMAHVLPLHNVFRDDIARDYLKNEEALANAPDPYQGQFRVPKVF